MVETPAQPPAPSDGEHNNSELWSHLTRVNQAWDRLLDLECAEKVIAPMARTSTAQEVFRQIKLLQPKLQALRAGKPTNSDFTHTLLNFEHSLDKVETEVLGISASIPMSLFRKSYDIRGVDEPVIIRYTTLLLRHMDEDSDRRDRIDFLVTRILSTKTPRGRSHMRPLNKIEGILRELQIITDIDTEAQEKALSFFRENMSRLNEFQTLDQFFESGFYLDIRGFKISLQEEFCDPKVLYAMAELNTTVSNRMNTFAEHEHLPSNLLDEKISEQEKRVQDIFSGTEDSPPVQGPVMSQQDLRKTDSLDEAVSITSIEGQDENLDLDNAFEEIRDELRSSEERQLNAKKKEAQKEKVLKLAGMGLKYIKIGFLAALVAGGFALAIKTNNLSKPQQEGITLEEIKKISPLLIKGSFSGNKEAPMFMGHLNSEKWLKTPPSQRKIQAQNIANNLKEFKVSRALIFRDGIMAMEISGDRVISVE